VSAAALMDTLREASEDARQRFIVELAPEDTDEVVRLLAGSFKVRDRFIAGEGWITIIEGANRREAVWAEDRRGHVRGSIKVYEPRIRSVGA